MKTNQMKGRHADTADRIEYRLLLAIAFSICLIAVAAKRLVGAFGASPAQEDIFAEAKSAAFAAVGYAFHA